MHLGHVEKVLLRGRNNPDLERELIIITPLLFPKLSAGLVRLLGVRQILQSNKERK